MGAAMWFSCAKRGSVTLDLKQAQGPFQAEWIHPVEGAVTLANRSEGGAERAVAAPGPGEAVLHVWKK